MSIKTLTTGLLAVSMWSAIHAQNCAAPTPSGAIPAATIDFIKRRMAVSDYACAAQATRSLRGSLATLPGTDGIDARFALREMAIDVSSVATYPSSSRLAVLRATVPDLDATGLQQAIEETKADVRALYAAGKQFQSQKDIAAWLDVLALAIRLDQKLADSNRRIRDFELHDLIPDSMSAYRHIDRLATLAELTRGDKALKRFRSDLANTTYFNLTVWKKEDAREVVIERALQLLRLTAALSDVKDCYGCTSTWQWRPIMRTGIAYQNLGLVSEAKAQVDKAIQIARSEENADRRLGQYRFVLSDLHGMHYDRAVVLALAKEMESLANSLDTPVAREVRESLPRTLKNWKMTP